MATTTLTKEQIKNLVPDNRKSPLSLGTDVSTAGTSRLALQQAGLDWTVRKVPMRNATTGKVVPGFFQVEREDNHEVVGVVEGQYKVVQNRDFFDIADVFVENGARISRLSYIHKDNAEVGGMIYMNLMWPFEKHSLNVVGDIVGRTAMIRNSHDGKTAALVRLILLRLACVNGMTIPVPGFSFDFTINHTESAEARIQEAHQVLSEAPKYWEGAEEMLTKIAKQRISDAVAERLTHLTIAPQNVDNPSQMTTNATNRCQDILRLYKDQPGSSTEAMNGTAYGWFNAVADYADHRTRVRSTAGFDDAQQRFKSAFNGNGQKMKLDAWKVVTKEVGLN